MGIQACTYKAVRAVGRGRHKSFPSEIKQQILDKVRADIASDKGLQGKLNIRGNSAKLDIIISISGGQTQVLLGHGKRKICWNGSIVADIKQIIQGKGLSGLYLISENVSMQPKASPSPSLGGGYFSIGGPSRRGLSVFGGGNTVTHVKSAARKSLPRVLEKYIRRLCRKLFGPRLAKGNQYKFKVLVDNNDTLFSVRVSVNYKGSTQVGESKLRFFQKVLRGRLSNGKFKNLIQRYKGNFVCDISLSA